MSRRSDIPTGASWQVGAHLRQRAGWRVRCPVDCLRGTGALRPSRAPASASRRLPGSRRLFDVGARTRGRPPASSTPCRHHGPHARDAGCRCAARGHPPHPRSPACADERPLVTDRRGGGSQARGGRRSPASVHVTAEPASGPIDRRRCGDDRGRGPPGGRRRPQGGQRGAGLPRGCLGPRRSGPPERGPHTDRGRLRGRGRPAARRYPRRTASQARLLARLPPFFLLRRAPPRHRRRPHVRASPPRRGGSRRAGARVRPVRMRGGGVGDPHRRGALPPFGQRAAGWSGCTPRPGGARPAERAGFGDDGLGAGYVPRAVVPERRGQRQHPDPVPRRAPPPAHLRRFRHRDHPRPGRRARAHRQRVV